jgi:phage baseplate assembly protein W
MADLGLAFGGDLAIGPTGDLALADGAALSQQRVLRRLLTNPGDYIWQLAYGAGLGQFVGQPGAPNILAGLVVRQMRNETGVGLSPAPKVTAAAGIDGSVTMSVSYTDAATQQISTLNFTV